MSNALGLFQDVIRKVDELAVIQRRGDERFDQYRVEAEARHRRSDERMDRLAEILQRFLDSQVRRNGEE